MSHGDLRHDQSLLMDQLGTTSFQGPQSPSDPASAAYLHDRLTRRSSLRRFATAAIAIGLVSVELGRERYAAAQTATPPAGTCTPATLSATDGAASSGCVEVGMFDIFFSPNLITIPADKPVTVQLKNNGAALHNFSVTDHKNPDVKNLNITVDVDPGKSGSVVIEAPAGDYYFYCNQPGHEQAGMFGFIQVKPDAEIKAEAATVTPPAES